MITKCPECKKTFTVPDDYIGRRCKCANCGKSFVVADSSSSNISASIDEPQEGKSSLLATIIIVALTAAALAGAAGYIAGTLTTRPKRAELDDKIASAVKETETPLQSLIIKLNQQIAEFKSNNKHLKEQNSILSNAKYEAQIVAIAARREAAEANKIIKGFSTNARKIEMEVLKYYTSFDRAALDIKFTNLSQIYISLCSVSVEIYGSSGQYFSKDDVHITGFAAGSSKVITAYFDGVNSKYIHDFTASLDAVTDTDYHSIVSKFDLILKKS